jgi:hypothetical protein
MNMNLRAPALLTLGLLSIGGCSTPPAEPTGAETPTAAAAPAGSDYAPVVTLNEIMVYVIDPHSNELWDASMRPPTSDEGWSALQRGAVAVAAAGSLTRLSGNGPNDQRWTAQADWAAHSQAMADAGQATLAAVRARDTAALSKAGDQLVLSCINCHREYKLDVPKIWTERQLPPEEQTRP